MADVYGLKAGRIKIIVPARPNEGSSLQDRMIDYQTRINTETLFWCMCAITYDWDIYR